MNPTDELIGIADSLGCKMQENVELNSYTTFKIGGAADFFVSPKNGEQLAALLKFCVSKNIEHFCLGRGSNILVADRGFRGVVIYTGGLDSIELAGENMIRCGSGVSLAQLCNFALEHSLSGLEFAFGIPGSVGGAVYMNAGAYGGEMKDVVVSVDYVTPEGEIRILSGSESGFGYRSSIYQNNGGIVLCATLCLKHAPCEEIKEQMMDFLSRRREKQPLEYPSAGSTFKRPQGYYAGALIEQCGLKGESVGGAQVSEKHAGFVINKGGATAADVLSLIELVQEKVMRTCGVMLEPEIKVIGQQSES